MRNSLAAPFLALCSCFATAVAADTADSVYLNGRIYTVNDSQPWAEAIAIRGDTLTFVGSNEGARALAGPSTRVVDLKGRMVMPGIHDAHTHFLWASMLQKFGCMLKDGEALDGIVSELRQCAKGREKGEWLVAGPYTYTSFPENRPHRKWLDQAFPDTPVYIREYSFHQVLLNTRALQVAGIDRNTPNPERGEIVKDDNGEPTGELVEEAVLLAQRFLPPDSAKQQLEALRWAVKVNNQYGITSIQEAATSLSALRALDTLDRGNELTLKVAAHLTWGSPRFGEASNEELEALIDNRAKYQTRHVRTDFVKMTLDGVPIPPYFTEAGIDDHCNVNLSHILIPPDKLNEMVTRFDKAGIKVKMHVTGAGAARVALDAIEAARKANPQSPIRHDLAHTNIITPQDLPRFRKLNAVAEMSPAVWQLFGRTLGNPPQPAWQFRTLLDHGVLMTVGSDWVVTPTPNLFPGLQGMLLRGEESVDLASALRMLTINGAISLGWDKTQGSLERGKLATFIVLDRNLFEVPATDVGATRVLRTVFEGRTVFEAGDTPAEH
jgi:predicted amidohydrolase YtcJ